MEWLTFNSINIWTDAAKKYLITIGMLEDKPGSYVSESYIIVSDTTVLIHSCSFFPFSVGVESEVSLVHPNDISWFLTVNETHDNLSSEGNTGGPT